MSSSQVNGIVVVPPSPTPNASQATATTNPNTASPNNSQVPPDSQSTQPLAQASQPSSSAAQQQQQHQNPPPSPTSASAPRPRDVRLIELLLTSSGVTSYEPRVPLLLLDFAYRHTSSVLTDALHHSYDPYTSQAGSKPSASSGAAANPPPNGDATVSANAIRLAIASRLNYQYRGGAGAGGIGRDFMQEVARERNSVALPKVPPSEWGIRLPSERFVLSGGSWGLRDGWIEEGDGTEDEDDDADEEMGGMEGLDGLGKTEDDVDGGNEADPGAMEDVFGDDVDEEMEE